MDRGTHLAIGDIGHAEDRVVRIINLHYEAGSDDIGDFFGNGYTIVDFIRGTNLKTNKNSVGYVLFATEQERINAQTLSGRRLLGREVKVLHAQGGFRISSSGDKLLSSTAGKNAQPLKEYEKHNSSPPEVSDLVAFPSLSIAATTRLDGRALAPSVPTRKLPGQQRALQNRLLFMNNVGKSPEVNERSFQSFFSEYTVLDVKRPLDPRTRFPNPTAFVMLASAEQRDEALHHLKNVPMQGRKVILEVPKVFQNVDYRGFVPSPNEDAVIFSTRRAGTVASDIAITHSLMKRVVLEDLQSDPPSILRQSLVKGSLTENADFHSLLGQLGMTDHGAQRQAPIQTYMQRQNEAEAVRKVYEKRQARKMELTWGHSREELSKRYIGLQRTLLPIPSGVESLGQVLTGPPLIPLAEYHSPFAQHCGSAPRGPPPNVETSFRPREYQWSLSGNQDPAHNIITEEAWYGGFQAH
ncbi:hypothetical protein EJ07DRAFT_156209 [Lizonia empirigonia]|nr:hypothetical protein EJ07DRAFT_156209 [Lizonia empirigonia]